MAKIVAPVPAARRAGRRGELKILWARFPRNPLKSLDSDEEIQGNPTLIIGLFAAKGGLAKKTQIAGPQADLRSPFAAGFRAGFVGASALAPPLAFTSAA
jgi:hypothetical protein